MPQLLNKDVGPIGYGLMGLTIYPDKIPTDDAIAAMKTALNQGATFWNGGEFYGPPARNSLHLVNEYFTRYPEDADKVILSIKGGIARGKLVPDCSPENIRASITECLRVLDGTKKIDVYECARVDPDVPVETSVGAIAEFVARGEVGAVSLSEVGAETIRCAAKVVPIAFVEVELSLYSTEILSNGVAQTCGELGIPIAAYSPLGRGFLTGAYRKFTDIPADSWLHHLPRFREEVFDDNLQLATEAEQIAQKKGVTIAQVAIAWVRQQSNRNGLPEVIPIPGASSEARVRENTTLITLSEEEMSALDEILGRIEIKGGRYHEAQEKYLFG